MKMFLLGNTVERKAPSLQIDVFKQDCSESVSEFLELFMQSMLKRNFILSFQKWLPEHSELRHEVLFTGSRFLTSVDWCRLRTKYPIYCYFLIRFLRGHLRYLLRSLRFGPRYHNRVLQVAWVILLSSKYTSSFSYHLYFRLISYLATHVIAQRPLKRPWRKI